MGTQTDPTPALISTASVYAIGGVIIAPVAAPGFGATAWTGANVVLYVPIVLPFNYSVARGFTCNGGAVSGNFDLGIYDANFTLLAHTGSTAQAGTGANQYATLNYTMAGSTRYYLALVFDNAVGTNLRASVISTIYLRPAGLLQQTATFPLPNNGTPAVFGSNYFPLFGVTRTASGF